MRWTYTAGRYYAGWGHKRNFKKKEEKGRKNLSGWRHRRSAASRPGSAPVEGTSRTLLCNSNVVVYPRQLMSRAHRRRHRTQHEDPALSLSLTRSTINLNNPSSPSLSLSNEPRGQSDVRGIDSEKRGWMFQSTNSKESRVSDITLRINALEKLNKPKITLINGPLKSSYRANQRKANCAIS